MTTLNDEILRATGGPTIGDGLATWFGQQSDEAIYDAEFRWLGEAPQSAVGETTGDRWMNFLGGIGQINDLKLQYWSGQKNLVLNGRFVTDTIWTKGAGWTIAGGVAVGAAGVDSDLSQVVAVLDTVTYRITFTIVSVAAAGVEGIIPNVGGTDGTPRFTVGTFTENLVSGASGSISLNKDIAFAGTIDNVSVRAV